MKILLLLLLSVLAQGAKLINGTPSDLKDWPASVYASMGNSRCTATVIGEKVLLIAAHCVANGGTASFKAGGQAYTAKCTHAAQYSHAAWEAQDKALKEGAKFEVEQQEVVEKVAGNATADWALCVVNKPVTGILFETVNQDPDLHKIGDKLTLTGYGCIRKGGGGGNDGIYRTGTSTIIDLPDGNDNDITTRGNAALCFGDSGGPAFFGTVNDRKVVSVNSRGDIKTTSYLASVSTDMAKTFFKEWSEKNKVSICGIQKTATNCRGLANPLEPFKMENAILACTVTVGPEAKFTQEWLKKLLQTTFDKMGRK